MIFCSCVEKADEHVRRKVLPAVQLLAELIDMGDVPSTERGHSSKKNSTYLSKMYQKPLKGEYWYGKKYKTFRWSRLEKRAGVGKFQEQVSATKQ
jgi:hypothetical protein